MSYGIDGEAYFNGILVHPLDQTMSAWTLEDPLGPDMENASDDQRHAVTMYDRVGFVIRLVRVHHMISSR